MTYKEPYLQRLLLSRSHGIQPAYRFSVVRRISRRRRLRCHPSPLYFRCWKKDIPGLSASGWGSEHKESQLAPSPLRLFCRRSTCRKASRKRTVGRGPWLCANYRAGIPEISSMGDPSNRRALFARRIVSPCRSECYIFVKGESGLHLPPGFELDDQLTFAFRKVLGETFMTPAKGGRLDLLSFGRRKILLRDRADIQLDTAIFYAPQLGKPIDLSAKWPLLLLPQGRR